MISIFTIALAANEAREVAISGEYFELRNAVYPITLIELLDRSGGVISRIENPEQSDFVRPGRYETIRITNGPTAQTVKHFYGSGDAGSRRTSGEVSVIDGGKSMTISNKAFIADASAPAVAGNFAHVQLWNPANSGKRVIIKSITCRSNTAGTIALGFNSIPLALINTTKMSKLSGGELPASQPRNENSPSPSFANAFAIVMNANVPFDHEFAEPIIATPGYGLTAYYTVVNSDLGVMFDYIEEAI